MHPVTSFEHLLSARRRSLSVSREIGSAARISMVLLAVLSAALPAPAVADAETLTGKAILEHPAGKAIVEAGRLMKAGKVGESRKGASKEVRDEWNAMTPAQQKEEATRLQGRTPDPARFEADIASVGEMVVDGDSARLTIPTPSGDYSAMGFAVLEGGKWRVNRGPMTLAIAEPDSAPPIRGAAILDHAAGKLALDYAAKVAAGNMKAVVELLSTSARAAREALPADERRASDDYRRRYLPKPEILAGQIREGGELTFPGQKAFLTVVSTTTTNNADGGVTSTSETIGLGFENEAGKWRIAN